MSNNKHVPKIYHHTIFLKHLVVETQEFNKMTKIQLMELLKQTPKIGFRTNLMQLKQEKTIPQIIMCKRGMVNYHSQMGGLWIGFNHITGVSTFDDKAIVSFRFSLIP